MSAERAASPRTDAAWASDCVANPVDGTYWTGFCNMRDLARQLERELEMAGMELGSLSLHIRGLQAELAAAKAQVAQITRERDKHMAAVAAYNEDCKACEAKLAERERELAKTQARLNWAANELLACDYGDNENPKEVIGWLVYGWRQQKDVGMYERKRIYGATINEAIDAEIP